MSIVNSWEKIIKIQKVYSFARSVLPFGFLILFFALSITFVLSYNLGIKYSDIMWAMMGLAIGQLDYLIRWKVGLSSWWNYELQIAVYTCFAIALLHHINRDVKPQVKWLMFLAPTILSLSLFFVSAPIRGMIVSGVKLTSWLQVVIYSFVAASGIFATAPLPHRRKNMQRMGIALAILIAVTLAATNILIEIKGIWLRDVNIIATIAIIASFISVDLVLFHRGYFTEKARRSDEELRRLHEEKEKIRFHTALTFGQTAQELLLPMSIDKTMNQRQIYYRCRPHINMAGDWMDTWVGPDGKTIVLLGDVTGKGPSAAIAMASIMTLLQEARDHKLDLAQTIGLMNPRLHTLFKGSIATTWAGAEISSDGNARFSGGGSPGWFVLSKDSLKSLSCRQPMLGMSGEIIQPQFESIALTKDDRIVSVSDGICGSSRQLKQLIGRLDTLKEKPSLELIELLFLFGDENKISDDQSLVVIEPTSLAS